MKRLAWSIPLLVSPVLQGCPGDDGGTETTAVASSTGTSSAASDTAMQTEGTTGEGSGSAGSGTTGSDPSTSSSGGDDTGDSSSGGGVMVPEPCDDEVFDWVEVEPNDTPEQATDACTTSAIGYWGNFPAGAFLGGADEVDYVVFKTPPNAGDVPVPISPCWAAVVDLLDVYVYEVDAGILQEPPIWESVTPATDCEGDQMLALPADTTFLLELRLVGPAAMPVNYFW